jgi:heat shock protein HtpX
MATLYTQQDKNVRKTWFLMTGFLGVVIALGFGFSYYFDAQIILYIAVIFAVLTNIFSYWYSDKIVIKMTGAKPADEREYRELHRILENLAITAGLPKPKLYVLNDSAPNAFATGLISILERNELEGVIAHELSHIGNRDILVSTVAVILAGFVAILADMFFRMMWFGGHSRDSRASGPILIASIVLAILAPIAAQLIHFAISRKREFLADASGALLTRYPEGLARALEKIHSHGKEMKKASHATAHLFIANPFGAQKGIGNKINRMFSTHPPVGERIRALRG